MKYECLRCGFIAKQKIHLENHLNRKNKCAPILEPISIEDIKIFYGFTNNSDSTQIAPFDTQTAVFSTQIAPSDTQNFLVNSTQIAPCQHPNSTLNSGLQHNSRHICKFCDKSFTRKTGLNKHLKICKYNSDLEKDKRILELEEKVEKLMMTSGNTINNTNSNNTTNITNNNNSNNVFILNNYGNENKDYITNDYLLKLLKKPFQAIPELIKHTHFNKEHPENQNIKITNKKQPYVKIRKNDKWELADRKDTICDLIDQKHSELNNSDLNDFVDNTFKQIEITRLERFNEKYMNDDKDFVSQLYKDTELVIINNS